MPIETDDPGAALDRLVADYTRVVTEALQLLGALAEENTRLRADLARLQTLEPER